MPVLDAVLNRTLSFDMRWHLLKRAPQVSLTKHQIDTFWKQAYLMIPYFLDAAQLNEIEEPFQRLFKTRAGWKEGDLYDIASLDQGDEFNSPQLLHPAKYAPELLRTVFWANAEAVAKELLGPDCKALLRPCHQQTVRSGVRTRPGIRIRHSTGPAATSRTSPSGCLSRTWTRRMAA